MYLNIVSDITLLIQKVFKRGAYYFILLTLTGLSFFNSNLATASSKMSLCHPDSGIKQENCTFVLLNGHNNKLTIINKKRAIKRISPFSTFKIPNSLIAFESGVVLDTTTPIKYDPNDYPAESWWPKVWLEQEHSIKSAFKYSVVPIYRTIATDIGEVKMQESLDRFNYGNKDIGSGIDNFWLDKSMQISAVEQVEFLRKVYEKTLDLKYSSYNNLKKIMLVEKNESYQLYAKTGGGQINNKAAQGWYVGYVIKSDTPYYFAFNMDATRFSYIQKKRIEIAKAELIRLGVLPKVALNTL